MREPLHDSYPTDEYARIGTAGHEKPLPSGECGVKVVLFNDAAFGADYSGIAALPQLNANGIAAAAVSAFTARIGDGRSTLNDGVVSAANDLAMSLGAEIGGTALNFIRRALG
jgi:hypothetical protein